MILSCAENFGDNISTLSPDSMPLVTGTLTAVVGLISFITQNSVWVSLDSNADFGRDAVLLFSDLMIRAFATKFSGICSEFTLMTTPCVCATVSTDGINDATLPSSFWPPGSVSCICWPDLT